VINPNQLEPKYFVKISENISVSKFWNISIGGRSNMGNWPNIGEKNLKIFGIGFKKLYWSVSILCSFLLRLGLILNFEK